MTKAKTETKVADRPSGTLGDKLNEVASRTQEAQETSLQTTEPTATEPKTECVASDSETVIESEEDKQYRKQASEAAKSLFDQYESEEFCPRDFQTEIPVDSLESNVGYTSLLRQMHNAYVRRVAFYRSPEGGSLSIEQARAEAFHACTSREEAEKIFDQMMRLPLDSLNFVDLQELYSYAPRAAEVVWEMTKNEGRREFESGHLAANITFPEGYMKGMWNIARYLGVRESFVDDWKPQGGIEVAMIDMLAQSYFQWQFWLEQTVKRSQTREKEFHPEYSRWLAQRNLELKANGITDGYWNRPYVSEQQAIEHAVQMADRFNRIFMRTLRQLRDLRRYAPVTINNPNQVNIAADGGQQVNINNKDDSEKKDSSSKPSCDAIAGE